MISADQALQQIFSLLSVIKDSVPVPLTEASGRVLARPVKAQRNQPPFAASAMDGFAIKAADAMRGARFKIIGESVAGCGFKGQLNAGEAIRIFTGAPIPSGAEQVIVQESTEFSEQEMTIIDDVFSTEGAYIRAEGTDFKSGTEITAPKVITAELVTWLAAMNIAKVEVIRQPVISILPTGNELQVPGCQSLGPYEIISSSGFGLAAMLGNAGASTKLLPIARDNESSLRTNLELAADSDLIVTLGGASVGDHDQVVPVAKKMGLTLAFQKVAMRPGKPLLAGRLFGKPLIGLPGNPVSTMVCGRVFLIPAIRALLGLGFNPLPQNKALLAADIPVNGQRQHFMRAAWQNDRLRVFARQDSSLMSVLAEADALVVRPPKDRPRKAGEKILYINLKLFLDT